ncbi:hypothetical protein M405DRAFT_864130 [Rhizopogon salebrosus TDB-379]|nr:hypothetical protein M405DRAFT_864130 [Rhizopogon salebrosus TDB-379]
MARPRYSVLNLFDPLNATPKREVTTPDSLSGSDKENAEPSYESYYDSDKLTMTAFFNRTYKTESKHYSPVVLRSRLIDVGDVTMMDETADLFSGLTIEDELEDDVDNMSLVHEHMDFDEQDSLATPRSSPPRQTLNSAQTPLSLSSAHTPTLHCLRTPFADISLDATPVPRKVAKPTPSSYEDPIPGIEQYSSPATAIRATHVTLAPAGSPLASVINAINFTEHKVPSKEVTLPTIPEVVVAGEESLGSSTAQLSPSPSTALLTHTQVPELMPPAPIVSFSHQHQTSHSRETLAAPVARPRPRARAHTTSSPGFDPRRSSVDLQSSFNMQLQCPESSFDLLNDRISFFGGDTIDADDFDMQAEEEIMEALAKRIKEKDALTEPRDDTASPAPRIAPSQMPQSLSPIIAANTPPTATRPIARRSSLSPGMKLSSPSPRPPIVATPRKDVPESVKTFKPVSPTERVAHSVAAVVTPPGPSQAFIAPVPAAPVHALRIVKRPKAHDRTTSVSSVDSSSTESSVSTEEQAAQAAPSVPIHIPVLTGVRRPPPGAMPALVRAKPAAQEGVRPALRSKITSVLGLRTKATEPPYSPLEACTPSQPAQMEKPPVGGTVRSRILKPTASSLSKAPSMKMPTPSNPIAASKSIRPPSRFVTVGMASGLPRPTGGVPSSSRLPVPASSMPKSKLPSTIGRGATIQRV